MDNVKIIKIETNGAITSVQDLRNHIKELQDVLVNTEKDTEEYNQTVDELVASQTKLNEVMGATKKNAEAAEGSYNALVNRMSALKTVWRATTSEVKRSQLGEEIKAINQQLKDYDASIGNNQRKVGAYEEALQTLNKTFDNQRKELAALKNALDNLEPGTDAYNEAFARAAEITHNLQERQEELRMSANDLGTQLGNVANIGAGLVGGFNAVQGIMAMTGNKSDELASVMVKLQGGIAVVQGLKGIEGMAKAMKGYVGWASKAYDNIVKWVSGAKSQQKQIEATTRATEKNTVANNTNAASETAVATGANAMNVSLKGAAGGFSVATVAATAFKAVLMSLGIGIIVAAISGLVTALGKLGSKWLNANKEARENTYNMAKYFDEEAQKREEKEQELFERRVELAKAQGKTELEILQMYEERYREHHDQMLKDVEGYEEQFNEASKRMREKGKFSAINKEEREWANKMMADILVLQEKGIDAVGVADKTIAEHFEKLKTKGAETYRDLQEIAEWFWLGQKQLADDYAFNPLGAASADVEAEAQSILKTAEDAKKSETKILKEGYQADVDALNKYYDSIGATEKTRKAGLRTLELAHRKKMWDIVTGATQSIIDTAHQANQTELENLEEKYQKELKILKQYGRDTTELTKAYEKQKAQIIYNGEVKATENAVKELERYASESGPVAKLYDQLEAMGVAHANDLEAVQFEQYEQLRTSLERQFEYWRDLWEKYQDDEKLTQDQRLSLQEKFLNAKNALEKSETDYLLKQIKTRKQALDEEISTIEKNYGNVSRFQSHNTEYKYVKNSSFGDTFWGARQNASYGQMKEDVNASYNIDKARLQEEIAAYQDYAANVAKTDAEITYAKEQEAAKRMELQDLERQNLIDNLNLEIDEHKELINTIVDVGQSIGDILGSVADAWESSIQAQVDAGKMSQEEADKQMENVRALQIVQATINMLAGSFGAFAQASETIPPPYGQIVGAAAAAAVIAQGIAQIAAIKAAGKNSGSSGGSTMMAQVTPVMTDYQPQMVGTATGEQETEQLANALQKQPIWVSVQDIDSAQERGRTRVVESTY